jgi:S1-C subfamily serine protease
MLCRHDYAMPLIFRLLVLALWLATTFPAAADSQPFRVVNRTDGDAVALYAVRTPRGTASDWGRNLLSPDRPLGIGAGFRVQPSESAGCRFDLRLVLADGRESLLRDRDICAEQEVAMQAALRVAPPPAPAPVPAPASIRPATPSVEQQAPNANARAATGTGFLVAPNRVLTNHHVIDGCNRVLLRAPDGRWLGAVPPARVDTQLDLALLSVPGLPGPTLAFRSGPAVRRGEGVVVFGFPLAGLLSSDPKLTRGEVNGLAGLSDNPIHFQISAEVQPGNSGGPMLDMQGQVIGVVVSKLNAQRVAQRTGDIAQNVNFAVKGEAALAFLRRAGAEVRVAQSIGRDLGAADIGEVAQRSTLFIRCEK